MYDDTNHIHSYENRTFFVFGHIHCMVGKTSCGLPSVTSHVHYYKGTVTLADGHVHHYSGITGPSIPLPGGGHVHRYSGVSTVDHGHSHAFVSTTSNEQFSHLFAVYR
ncbi:MAG: YmaF family protein [Desulfitobacteriaceae bacterium]|nr:YmaF family protein [Desulfitobacteriaceae bacterium]MDI6916133.1 YmaF family protein [Desulfitobacteriaceae bacterium]